MQAQQQQQMQQHQMMQQQQMQNMQHLQVSDQISFYSLICDNVIMLCL